MARSKFKKGFWDLINFQTSWSEVSNQFFLLVFRPAHFPGLFNEISQTGLTDQF